MIENKSVEVLLKWAMKQKWWKDFVKKHGFTKYSGPSMDHLNIKRVETSYLPVDMMTYSGLKSAIHDYIVSEKIYCGRLVQW
jgi:hypothetical protein